jgi:hypothetical protein
MQVSAYPSSYCKPLILICILARLFSVSAQGKSLTGTIIAADSVPIRNARVTLAGTAIEDTTNDTGFFRLLLQEHTGGATGSPTAIAWREPHLTGNSLHITNTTANGKTHLTLFSLQGRTVARKPLTIEKCGTSVIDIRGHFAPHIANGRYILIYQHDHHTRILPYLAIRKSNPNIFTEESSLQGSVMGSLHKRTVQADTVIIEAIGYRTRKISISTRDTALGTVQLAFLYGIDTLAHEISKARQWYTAGRPNQVMSTLLLDGQRLMDSSIIALGPSAHRFMENRGQAMIRTMACANLTTPRTVGSSNDYEQALLDLLKQTSCLGILSDGKTVSLQDYTIERLRTDSIRLSTFFAGYEPISDELGFLTNAMSTHLPSPAHANQRYTIKLPIAGESIAGMARTRGPVAFAMLGVVTSLIGAAVSSEVPSVKTDLSGARDDLRQNRQRLDRILQKIDTLALSLDTLNANQQRLESLDSIIVCQKRTESMIAVLDSLIDGTDDRLDMVVSHLDDLDAALVSQLNKLATIESEILYLKQYITGATLIQQINGLRGRIRTFAAGPTHELAVALVNDYDALVLNFIQFALDNHAFAVSNVVDQKTVTARADIPVTVNRGVPDDRAWRELGYPSYSTAFASFFTDTVVSFHDTLPDVTHHTPFSLADMEFLAEVMTFRFTINRYYVESTDLDLAAYNSHTAEAYLDYLEPLRERVRGEFATLDSLTQRLTTPPAIDSMSHLYSAHSLVHDIRSFLLEARHGYPILLAERNRHFDYPERLQGGCEVIDTFTMPSMPHTVSFGTYPLPTEQDGWRVWFNGRRDSTWWNDPLPDDPLRNPSGNVDTARLNAASVWIDSIHIADFDPGYTTHAWHSSVFQDYVAHRNPSSAHNWEETNIMAGINGTRFTTDDGMELVVYRNGYHSERGYRCLGIEYLSQECLQTWEQGPTDRPPPNSWQDYGSRWQESSYPAERQCFFWHWFHITPVKTIPFWREIPREMDNSLWLPIPKNDQPVLFVLSVDRGLEDTERLGKVLARELTSQASQLVSVAGALVALEVLLRAYATQ